MVTGSQESRITPLPWSVATRFETFGGAVVAAPVVMVSEVASAGSFLVPSVVLGTMATRYVSPSVTPSEISNWRPPVSPACIHPLSVVSVSSLLFIRWLPLSQI